MNLFGIPVRPQQGVALGGDLAVAFLALYLGHVLRFTSEGASISFIGILELTTGASVFFVGTHILLLYLIGAYEIDTQPNVLGWAPRLWMAAAGAFFLQMAIFYAAPNWQWGRGVTLIGFLSFSALITLWRAVDHRFLGMSVAPQKTIILGLGPAGAAVGRLVLDSPDLRHTDTLLGFVAPAGECGLRADRAPILGPPQDLAAIARSTGARQIIVAQMGRLDDAATRALLELKSEGIRIVDMPTYFKNQTGRLPIHHMGETWMIFAPGFSEPNRLVRAVTRMLDLTISAAILIMTLPFLVLAALAIKLSSRGPVLYTQERLGQNKVPFVIYKLRTMRQDAEKGTGAVWSTGKDDPRVTRVGRFLRRSRLDELPQLFNVVRGDMALVGPRPEREPFVRVLEEQIPYYRLRFAAKPGLTGWAQISFRYAASVDETAQKLEYELYGIQENSPFLYLLVLVKTVQTVLLRPGS